MSTYSTCSVTFSTIVSLGAYCAELPRTANALLLLELFSGFPSPLDDNAGAGDQRHPVIDNVGLDWSKPVSVETSARLERRDTRTVVDGAVNIVVTCALAAA